LRGSNVASGEVLEAATIDGEMKKRKYSLAYEEKKKLNEGKLFKYLVLAYSFLLCFSSQRFLVKKQNGSWNMTL